jgi:hypothetical protein
MQQFTSSLTNEAQEIIQTLTTEYFKKWIVDEIDFFDSDIDEDDSIVNVERHVFYKDIYVFVDRLKNMISIREDDKLRTMLSQCFRDFALIWHFTKLFDMKKDLLRQTNLVSWYQAMINRFKKRTSLAFSALQNSKYSLTDARARKKFKTFRSANFSIRQNS